MSIKINNGLNVFEDNNTAFISISGELINMNEDLPSYFNYVPLGKLEDIIDKYSKSASIENIVFLINSSGGSVFGISDIVRKIKNMNKNKVAICGYICASASYWIATATEKIIATTDISYFGSVGVVASSYVSDNTHIVTNKEGIKKHPDIRTADGKEIISSDLSSIYDLFIESVATNRNINLEKAKSMFGDGGAYLPKEALAKGLIDEIDYEAMSNIHKYINIKKDDVRALKIDENSARAILFGK